MIPRENTSSSNDGDQMGTSVRKKERKRWPGGYIREGVFIIEKKIQSKKFHISTHATSLRAALKQLERFESDPSGYRPQGGDGPELVLDKALVEQFFEWHSAKCSRHWAMNVRSLLFDWTDALKGSDLRRLNLMNDLKAHLDGASQRHHRAKSIKLLFKWLRQERGLVTRAQDVTLDLPVPVIAPAQQHRIKAVPWASVVAVTPHLPGHVRDVLEVLAATGWHVSEIRRFAESGLLRPRNAGDPEGVVAMIGTVHKSGRKHFTALVHQEHADAAARIRERGHVIDNSRLRKHMLRAAAAAGVEPFQLGSLRHSVATWLQQAGITVNQSSQYLGHASPRTLLRHYVDLQAAALVLPARALRVVG